MRTQLIIGAIVVALVGAIIWAVVSMNRWQHECEASGGTVISEYIGQIETPILDGKGNVIGESSTPNYAYSCEYPDGGQR